MLRSMGCLGFAILFSVAAVGAEPASQAAAASAPQASSGTRGKPAVPHFKPGPATAPPASRATASSEKKGLEAAAPTGKIGGPWSKRTVYRLKHAPALDIAQTINAAFREEAAVSVLAEPVTNSLVIVALPGAMEEAVKMITELDRCPPMVSVEVLIARVKRGAKDEGREPAKGVSLSVSKMDIATQLRELEKRGKVEVLEHPQLMTLDNQPAYLQVGQRVPRITGSNMTSSGRHNSVTLENVGMIVGITPRIADDRTVTLELDVEKSQLGATEEGAAVVMSTAGDTLRTPGVITVTAQSTLMIPDGQTAVLAGLVSGAKPEQTELIVLVSPKIQPAP